VPFDEQRAEVRENDGEALYGCLEAGGTKFLCAVGTPGQPWLERTWIVTETPVPTMNATIAFFKASRARHGPMAAIGVASFGPLQLDPRAPDWGALQRTPKKGWSGVSPAASLRAEFAIPVGLDTDVNAAAMAEAAEMADGDRSTLVYVTVGTGIGGGAVIGGLPVHGFRHPEMGHIVPPRHPLDQDFPGVCPHHGGCIEGLASGPAILARWGQKLSDLAADHPAHEIAAWYLAHLAVAVMSVLSPNRIVLGGGVMNTPGLLQRVRAQAARFNAGYFAENADVAEIIRGPVLGQEAGLIGALLLARRAAGQVC
jgi:fructokinase